MATPDAALWRPMAEADLPAAGRVAAVVHPDFPEDAAVLAERLALFAAGCLVLVTAGQVGGYVVAHPWSYGHPPPLNTRLRRLPARADTLYLHDLAILPGWRGGGAGSRAVELLIRRAELDGFRSLSLVAVGASPPFWRGMGFEVAPSQPALASYPGAVFMARPVRPSRCGSAGKAAG